MISAVILAAGQSRRMGQPKMLLPWAGSTVLQTVIHSFQDSGLDDILVVTGAGHEQVESLIAGSATTVFNPDYAQGEMLSSIQRGLAALPVSCEAALIALGDQPQIETGTIRLILDAYRDSRVPLIVPSYENRRGHPWLVGAEHWPEIAALHSPFSMRDFFRTHSAAIHYVPAANSSILADLDTPEDYRKYRQTDSSPSE